MAQCVTPDAKLACSSVGPDCILIKRRAPTGEAEVVHLPQEFGQFEALTFGPYQLIPSKRLLLVGQNPVELGSRAFDILTVLLQNRGRVVSRREILDRVWPDLTVDEANLRVQMSDLRRALKSGDSDGSYIMNVQGRGYVFVAPVQTVPLSEPGAAGGAPVAADRRMPRRPPHVIGREDTISALVAQVLACRFVTIVGPGGIGKTTLAAELSHRLAYEFGDEIRYVDLGALKAADLVLPTIAVALGYTAHTGDPLTALASFMGDRRLLLIVDCCEHVIEEAADVTAGLFQRAPKLHLVATSREVLRAAGETVYFVEPLDLPADGDDLTASEVLRAPSAQLLMERATASGYVGSVEDAHAVALAKICRRLDGNPLAIELAASRLITYGFKGLLDGLRGRAVLQWPGRRHESRHRTLEATLDWSFRLLSDVERRVLVRLSILIGPFSMQSAQAVAVDAIDDQWTVARAVEELTDKSLIAILPVDDTYLYRMPDITRFYAEMKLAESGGRQEALRRHAQYSVEALRQADVGPRHTIGRTDMKRDLHVGNVRAALEWCFSGLGDGQLGVSLAAFASRMLLDRSMLRECLRWCEIAAARIGEKDRSSITALRLYESLSLCRMYLMANDDQVDETIRRALQLAVALGERESEMHLLAGLNLFLTRRADYTGALAAAERFAELAQDSQNSVEIAASEWMLGSTHNLIGHQPLGLELIARGIARAEALGIGKTYYFGYDNKGRGTIGRIWTSWLCGLPETALRRAAEVLDVKAQDHPVSTCIAYLYTTVVVLWARDLDWAERLVETLIDFAHKHQLKPYRTGGMALKGELLVARGQIDAGVALLRGVIEPLQAEQLTIMRMPAMRAYADGLARMGNVEQARSVIADLVKQAKASPTYLLPELLRTQGDIMLVGLPEERSRAEECYRKALDQARIDGALGWELRAALSLGQLWRRTDRAADAADLLERIVSKFTEGFETADLVAARQMIQSKSKASGQEEPRRGSRA
ncbi:winged helix-turn-helix domain-containing protein [Bradyrhizobium liaoningense]|uniref:ATP-binding protein n=1 Tax=Bradyrhizobium liaoningense TaxID=43992 RepID=UPI001BA5A99E|nr:winged helix-turn-helix domain-containing protein [Bradyrhizobium liaoningense]MBR0816620.1 winged helix-turn-helix domain-containing protein [Bradyrhizobium liaoningense]